MCNQCFDGDPAGTTYPDQYQLIGTSAELEWITDNYFTPYDPSNYEWRQYTSQDARFKCWNGGDAPGFTKYIQSELEDKTYAVGDFRRVREIELDKGVDDNTGFYPQCSTRRLINQWLVPRDVTFTWSDQSEQKTEFSYYTT